MRVTYCGVFDAVDVAVPEYRTVRNGESIEVADAIANDLLEQTANWAKSPSESPKGGK